jgi:three-Cys-motif partner protein
VDRTKTGLFRKLPESLLSDFCTNTRAKFLSTHYVDAFAGTGAIPRSEPEANPLFPELQNDVSQYIRGSAVRALEVKPGFDHYLFIERDPKRALELQALKTKYPNKASRISVNSADANAFLKSWCGQLDWHANRAVAFIDPFGMEVDWDLIETIAKTRAIDLWLLFPLFATNRMLVRNSRPPEAWSRRLTQVFGTCEWQSQFYKTEKSTLIEDVETTTKIANLRRIEDFFIKRLQSVFAAVAKPMVLRNNRAPLYLFCFAAGNARGAPTALKIAQHLIGE